MIHLCRFFRDTRSGRSSRTGGLRTWTIWTRCSPATLLMAQRRSVLPKAIQLTVKVRMTTPMMSTTTNLRRLVSVLRGQAAPAQLPPARASGPRARCQDHGCSHEGTQWDFKAEAWEDDSNVAREEPKNWGQQQGAGEEGGTSATIGKTVWCNWRDPSWVDGRAQDRAEWACYELLHKLLAPRKDADD